jgi:hypothetical protein
MPPLVQKTVASTVAQNTGMRKSRMSAKNATVVRATSTKKRTLCIASR